MSDQTQSQPTLQQTPRLSLDTWRNRIWSVALQASGYADIPGVSIHSLRHSYASIAIAHGADVTTLQAAMGHASAAMTLDIYANLWPHRLDDVTQAIDLALKPTLSQPFLLSPTEKKQGRNPTP
ncbi:tyrosine-type recombinase/integrase [Bifidobacterium aquikefiricola]|uniref:tyrosine-type recombinase/integrase n=1 Tax=Bifidobacterium aquikefiricola TaxID=3059038 RepID=UPI0034E20A78